MDDLRFVPKPRGTWKALVALTALAVVTGGLWFMSQRPEDDAPARQPEAALQKPAPPPEPAAPPPPPAPAEEQQPAPENTAAATATPPAVPSERATTDAGVAAAEGARSIIIRVRPPDAKIYRRGKEVGTSTYTVTLPPGERLAYEVGKPGYVTRKVLVDGTKSDIFVGLRPETASAPAGSGSAAPAP